MPRGFRLGSLGATTSAVGVPNQGLSRYAAARVDNTVARAVRRHQEAMRVDGVQIYIWRRQMGGLICTCRQPAKPLAREEQIANPTTADEFRQARTESTELPPGGEIGDVSFQVLHMRGRNGVPLPNPPLPPDFIGLNDPAAIDNGLESGGQYDGLDALTSLDQAERDLSDEDLARLLSEGAAISGGDKTACGICFGTGRTHGYGLINGQRMILDASNEWRFSFTGNSSINYAKFPARFELDSRAGSSVVWNVDIPTYTTGWLGIAVRNNLRPANNVKVQWLRDGIWQDLTTEILIGTDGTDRRGSNIRVISDGTTNSGENLYFSHVELTYISAPPIRAALPALNISTNYDVFEPTVTTEFEVMGMVDALPRESIMLDTKFKMLWKVVDSTAKMTASGQIFAYTINARSVASSEMFYALKLPLDPFVTVNYRGLERVQGGLTQTYWSDSIDVPNDFTFPEEQGDNYNTSES